MAIKASVLVTFSLFRDSYDNGNGSFIQLSGKVWEVSDFPLRDKYWNVVHPYWDWLPMGIVLIICLGIWAGTLLDNGSLDFSTPSLQILYDIERI